MGETASARAKRDAEIQALVEDQQKDDAAPACKHGCATMPCRHTRTEEKHKKIIDLGLRGVPLVGSGPGCIDGTRPGDPLSRLELAERELAETRAQHAAMMRRARANLGRKETT